MSLQSWTVSWLLVVLLTPCDGMWFNGTVSFAANMSTSSSFVTASVGSSCWHIFTAITEFWIYGWFNGNFCRKAALPAVTWHLFSSDAGCVLSVWLFSWLWLWWVTVVLLRTLFKSTAMSTLGTDCCNGVDGTKTLLVMLFDLCGSTPLPDGTGLEWLNVWLDLSAFILRLTDRHAGTRFAPVSGRSTSLSDSGDDG